MSAQPTTTIADGENNQNDVTENGDVVNLWEVKAESMTGVDYDKIIDNNTLGDDSENQSTSSISLSQQNLNIQQTDEQD